MLASNYDFSSPFFKAAIIVNPGKGPQETRYELWFQNSAAPITVNIGQGLLIDGYTGGDQSGKLSLSTLSIVTDVSIELGLGYIPQLSATLAPTFEDGRKLLDSEVIEWSTSALEIQFGYTNSVASPAFRGIIGQPNFSYGTDISIGLTAQGVAGYFLNTTGLKGVFESKSRLDHINDLAQKLGILRDPSKDNDVDEKSLSLLNQEVPLISGTKSYLANIYDLARASNCWLDLSENRLKLISMTKLPTEEPKATLRLYDFPDGRIGPGAGPGGTGVYPILSASSETVGIYLSSYSKKAVMEAINRTTKTETTGELDPSKVTTQQKGDALPNNESSKQSDSAQPAKDQTDDGASKVQQQADTAMQALSSTDSSGINLEIETLGIPDILPRQNVNVVGLGTRIDGKYTVQKVVHKLSSSGYTSTLTLLQYSAKLAAALGGALAVGAPGQKPSAPPLLDDGGGKIQVSPLVQRVGII